MNDVITQLNNEIKTYKTNNTSNNTEEKSITKEQNKTIKHLQDVIILKDEYIKKIEQPIDKTIITGQKKIYKHKEEIPDYESRYKRFYDHIVKPNGKKFRLNITMYKRYMDYKVHKETSMKYLEELGITKNEKTQKYDMTKIQLDALIEKMVLYYVNGCDGLLF